MTQPSAERGSRSWAIPLAFAVSGADATAVIRRRIAVVTQAGQAKSPEPAPSTVS